MRYNPRAPYIIGEEWVPIRQASYLPSQEEERGYTFTIDAAATIVSGAFYVQTQPYIPVSDQVEIIALYRGDTEDLTGPLMQVVIPASAISVTGDVIGDLADLLNPSDDELVGLFAGDGHPNTAAVGIQFDVSAYQNALQGKRIVDAALLYTTGSVTNSAETAVEIARALSTTNALEYGIIEPADPSRLNSVDFDSVNVFWTAGVTASSEQRAYPWRWEELNLFDETAAAATKLQVIIRVFTSNSDVANTATIGYAALQVIFCEEQRILYGGKRIVNIGGGDEGYTVGPSFVQLRNTSLAIPSSSTAAGGYFVSHSHRQLGEARLSENKQPPTLYGLRQLYEIPTMQSKIVDITQEIGDEFTSATSDVVPYITLHTASAIVTGVHAYGEQVPAPVYGSITAVQSVNGLSQDGAANGPFTQVRFYARRFGSSSGTLILRQGATTQASITEDEFDALPLIVDGWREVTLDLDNDITFSSTDVSYTWEALGVAAGSRWEVLGGDGPAFTGSHSNAFASYEQPNQGHILELFWKKPNQLSTTEDDNSDAVLIFSQDPPTVTGFTVVGSGCSIPVTGIGADCNLSDACLPTAIHGNALSWTTGVLCESYSREIEGEWGTADTGQVTTTSGGTADNYFVRNGQGIFYFPANNVSLNVTYPVSMADLTMRGEVRVSGQPTGASVEISLTARHTDGTHFVQARLFPSETGTVSANLRYFDGGGEVGTGFIAIQNLTATTRMAFTFEIVGVNLRLRVWPASEPEPIGVWHLTFVTTLITAGDVIVDGAVSSSVTGPFPMEFAFDNLTAIPFALEGATVEVQREDDLTDWQTIATVSPCVTGMCDLEARVGMESRYRIRTCNVLDFCGPWVTGAGTITAPGVTIDGDGNGVLIFTSNRNPDASLAYTMGFERDASEEFGFPEAAFTRVDAQFGRDFFVAFRPLERGGDDFSRNLLVNAMAIPVESLPDINDLRDLAWDDLPYVCVRDELGNRWFANVRVPAGRIRRNRTLYYAQIDVLRVTDTAAPVEGGGV